MLGVYNKDNYLLFLERVVDYLIFEKDINIVDDVFLKYIINDKDILLKFKEGLPKIKKEVKEDLDFFMVSDPAIKSMDEVIYAYPGYKAITTYRIAHLLYVLDLKLQARLLSEVAHSITGIDIHPGAKISSPFFIDHGTGTVIGETSVISSYVKIYQGVTLGALSLKDIEKIKNVKRHPTILENVTIYACATILGDVTIGANSVIGANVFLTEDVKDNVIVRIGKPSLIFKEKK